MIKEFIRTRTPPSCLKPRSVDCPYEQWRTGPPLPLFFFFDVAVSTRNRNPNDTPGVNIVLAIKRDRRAWGILFEIQNAEQGEHKNGNRKEQGYHKRKKSS